MKPADDLEACGDMERVAAEMPCRALVIETTTATGAPAFEAWISAHGRRTVNGREQLSCEQVTLRVAPEGLPRLPSALLGLLLPDLPVVLVVPDPHDLESQVVERMRRSIDRCFVDSTHGAPATDGHLTRLAAWGQERPGLEIEDLAWMRLEPWRERIAEFFDAPPFDAALSQLGALHVRHDAGARPAALLLVGWLASRLQWQARRSSPAGEMTFAAPGPVTVELSDAGDAIGARPDLRQVELVAQDGTRFVVEATGTAAATLESRILAHAACPLPQRQVRAPLSDEALLLRLLVRGRSRAYGAALTAAARLVALRSAPA